MRKLRKYVVKNSFKEYLPERSDFEIVEECIPSLKTGEFLVKAEYISVDPYMRAFACDQEIPYEQFGFQVGKVEDSKNSDYPVDEYVVSHSGWRDYTVLNGDPDEMFDMRPYHAPIDNLPVSYAVGALGMPGMTAYLGFLEVCRPVKGDVVCVTSAAGTVGSIVGQIAKLKGCTVIGFAGTDEKVKILIRELRFDYALNYKTEAHIKENLKAIAPNGINCFFDNVGGNLANIVIECMNASGRIAMCGAISTYGQEKSRYKRSRTSISVRIEAFSFTQWDWTIQSHALEQLREWIRTEMVKVKETVSNGFEELPNAFIGMLNGENIGKTLVKV